jgi:peptide/nickel transport system substrate-binding protein
LQADKNYQVLLPSVPGSPQILPMNAAKAPTDDINVRKAIISAIDMESVVNTLWFGTRKTAKAPLSSPTWTYNDKVTTMYPYDTKKAAQLLDDAGWKKGSSGVREKDGQPLTLEYVTVTGIQGRAGELIQAYLTDAGFKVNLQQLEYAATAALMLAGKHNIARIYFSHTDPVVLTTLYHSKNIQGTNFNRTMKPDPKLDKMLDDATAEMDRDKRAQMYMDIQQYIMEQALMIPLWEETVFWGASSKVKNINFQPLGGIWFYDVWLEK